MSDICQPDNQDTPGYARIRQDTPGYRISGVKSQMPTRKVVFFIRTNTTYLRLSFYIVVSVTTYVHVQVYPRYEEIEGTVAMVVGLSYRKR